MHWSIRVGSSNDMLEQYAEQGVIVDDKENWMSHGSIPFAPTLVLRWDSSIAPEAYPAPYRTRHGAPVPPPAHLVRLRTIAATAMIEVSSYHLDTKEVGMIWGIVVVLFILWLVGFLVFEIAGALIHLLLVLAVIAIVYQVVTGRRVV